MQLNYIVYFWTGLQNKDNHDQLEKVLKREREKTNKQTQLRNKNK